MIDIKDIGRITEKEMTPKPRRLKVTHEHYGQQVDQYFDNLDTAYWCVKLLELQGIEVKTEIV